METMSKKSGKYRGVRLLVCCLFLLFYSSGNQVVAQAATDSAKTDTASSKDFAKKGNISKIFDEAKKIQAENEAETRRSDIITWVVMILGFSLVIGVAWFTTSLAKKRQIIEDEKKAKRLAIFQQQNPHRKPHRR